MEAYPQSPRALPRQRRGPTRIPASVWVVGGKMGRGSDDPGDGRSRPQGGDKAGVFVGNAERGLY